MTRSYGCRNSGENYTVGTELYKKRVGSIQAGIQVQLRRDSSRNGTAKRMTFAAHGRFGFC